MGLDMYLYRNTYLYQDTKVSLTEKGGIVRNISNVSEIKQKVAYWRKANAIHNWFVENVQDGEDDCKDYEVSREKLLELVSICKKVLEVAKTVESEIVVGTEFKDGKSTDILEDGSIITNYEEIEKLLPTSSGFFFGSTEYDNYYLDSIRATVEMIEEALNNEEEIDGAYITYSYRSSW